MPRPAYLILARLTLAMCLEQLLKQYRLAQSACRGVPCYFIFGDVVLKQLAASRPESMEALQKIKGIGPEKLKLYGRDILNLIAANPSQEPKRPKAKLNRSRVFQKLLREPPCRVRHNPAIAPTLPKKVFEPTQLGKEDEIYILELSHGKVYVGKTQNKSRRVSQHVGGFGSAFTRAFPPTGKQLPRLGNVSGSGDAAERDETLRYMFMRGVDNVRGWRYTQVHLSKEDEQDAELNIRELFDLCRKCGQPGHFISNCRYSFDRLGRKI